MGNGRFDPHAYGNTTRAAAGKSRDEIFVSRDIHPDLNPHGKTRESCDSADNPNATPIIVALDVTGSMGHLAEAMLRGGVGVLFGRILAEKPVPDPHLMFMAVGDARTDKAPLQVSQFEADNRIVEQLGRVYLEGNGGGNAGESYDLPWYFAAAHTKIDCVDKRGARGFLFTVGDEPAPPGLTVRQIEKVVGDKAPRPLTPEESLAGARQKYDVFHIVVAEGDGVEMYGRDRVIQSWRALLGERVLVLEDHTKLADVIVEALSIAAGAGASAQLADPVIARAIGGLLPVSV